MCPKIIPRATERPKSMKTLPILKSALEMYVLTTEHFQYMTISTNLQKDN